MNVSVCLATYNGEKYILEQIQSILIQLDINDELIISDDKSFDKTLSIINEINDDRIKIIKSPENCGHVKNFEKAIKLASKEIILLSDQDDVWKKHKLLTIKDTFNRNPNINLIFHGLELVDHNLNSLDNIYSSSKTRFHHGYFFSLSHLFKGRIFGCASAFRSKIKNKLLPIPDYVLAHDHWIGIIGGFSTDVIEIHECLVLYRQHEKNLTAKKFNLINAINNRLSNFRSILRAIRLTLTYR